MIETEKKNRSKPAHACLPRGCLFAVDGGRGGHPHASCLCLGLCGEAGKEQKNVGRVATEKEGGGAMII